jgi:hypothetical protein
MMISPSAIATKLQWSNISAITIEGFAAQETSPQRRVSMMATSAELNQPLKTQRLTDAQITIEFNALLMQAQAQTALIHENEILLGGNAVLTIQRRLQASLPKKHQTRPTANLATRSEELQLRSAVDPISVDLSQLLIRGNAIEARVQHRDYRGRSFRLDLKKNELVWVGELQQRSPLRNFTTPYRMPVFMTR